MFLENKFNFKVDAKVKLYEVLKEEEAHIWSLYLPNQKRNIEYLSSILSNDEKKKANNFKFTKDREQFLITRGTLRCILARYLQKRPGSIDVSYSQWGKPCLPEPRTLHFNISHSENYSLLAFTRSCEIGIDLEIVKNELKLDEMVEIVFSATELSCWRKMSSEKKVDYFYKVWVGREAFLKALGKGWLENDKNIREMKLFPNNTYENSENSYRNTYGTLEYFQIVPGYKSAFFTKGATLKPLFINWENVQSVLENFQL